MIFMALINPLRYQLFAPKCVRVKGHVLANIKTESLEQSVDVAAIRSCRLTKGVLQLIQRPGAEICAIYRPLFGWIQLLVFSSLQALALRGKLMLCSRPYALHLNQKQIRLSFIMLKYEKLCRHSDKQFTHAVNCNGYIYSQKQINLYDFTLPLGTFFHAWRADECILLVPQHNDFPLMSLTESVHSDDILLYLTILLYFG